MRKQVLIVDDSNTNNILIESILETEGINSIIATNGNEALEILKKTKPTLILLDIMMPQIDGFMVLKKIKTNPETKEIPVIFITAKNEDKLENQALKAGATKLIKKPLDINKLVELVKIHLSN